jgi:hypothetical protein
VAARRDLRAQIARLERDLGEALAAAFPRREPEVAGHLRPAPVPSGPRLLELGELERVRDHLAARLQRMRAGGAAPRLAAMRADPATHRGGRVTSAELGEPGCRVWVVRPRLGPLGRLAGWWHVVVSSGCPLP